MKDKTRDLLVGLTVIVALALMGAMIIVFQELPAFLQTGYKITIHFWESGQLDEGADVTLAGQRIGRVIAVDFADDNPAKGVHVAALIDRDVRIPGDANVYLAGRGLTGGAAVTIRCDQPGTERRGPDGKPLKWVPTDNSIVLQSKASSSAGLFPRGLLDDVGGAADAIAKLATRLDAFFTPPPPASGPAAATAPAEPKTIFTTLAKLNAALDSFNKTFGDAENQKNIKASLASLKESLVGFKAAADATKDTMVDARELVASAKATFGDVSDAAKGAGKRFDDLAGKLIDDADRLGKVLTSIHRVTVKIETGEGTAGKLLNDAELYNGLVDATAQLKDTLERLSALLAEWKQQGVKMKLK